MYGFCVDSFVRFFLSAIGEGVVLNSTLVDGFGGGLGAKLLAAKGRELGEHQ